MKIASSGQVAVLYLLLYLVQWQWSRAASEPATDCPATGWSCSGGGGDTWRATSKLAGTEGVVVTYDAYPQRRVNIYCDQYSGNNLRFPKGFLENFAWDSSVSNYRFVQCPLPPANETFSAVLRGKRVEFLRLTATPPLGDFLDADVFDGLPDLQSLNLAESGLTSLPDGLFSALPKLTTVNLKDNRLSQLPRNTFAALKALRYLELSGNNLTEMTEAMEGFENLETIQLYHNQIEKLSRRFFASMPLLQTIDLQDNRLTDLPPDLLHDVPSLKSVKLFKNQIREIPLNFLQFQTQLAELDVSDNPRLSSLPSKLLFNLTTLSNLNLERCNLQKIPAAFFQSKRLFGLSTLLLSRNKLKHLEPGIFRDLANLTVLNLAHNRLTELSQGVLSGLKKLTTLQLENNQLTAIHRADFDDLTALTAVHLNGNNLTELGDVFTFAANLKELYLSENDLNFSEYDQKPFPVPLLIEVIDLSHNRIKGLPSVWFMENTQLKKVDLSYNFISNFDSEQCQPVSDNLILDLTHNQITSARLHIQLAEFVAGINGNLPSRDRRPQVLLGHNPFRCDCEAKDLLNYYRRQSSKRYPFVVEVENLECESPASLAGRPVATLRVDEMSCEIDESCPDRCKCQKHASGNAVEVDCRLQGLTEVPPRAPFNTSVLRLDNNNLRTLSGLERPPWANVTHLYLSNNQIGALDASRLPKGLKLLDLGGNQLTNLSKGTLEELDTRPEMVVLLQENPWSCQCEAAHPFKLWLYENAKRIGNVSNIHCNDTDQPLYLHDVCPLPSVDTRGILVGATVLSLVLAVGLATVGIAYYRYRQEIKIWLYARHWCLWFVTESEIDRDKTYDAFVSFSQEDAEFVASQLLPGLEQGEPKYKVCIHYRDWLAGEWIPDQIVRSVQDSRRTIVILTKNFIRSVWGRLEFKAAHHQALQDQKNRIIIVVFGDLPPHSEMDPELKMYVKFNTYLKWDDPWFWQKIRYAMPHSPLNMPPLRSSSTLSNLSSSITEQPRIPMTRIANSVHNGISEDKLELV